MVKIEISIHKQLANDVRYHRQVMLSDSFFSNYWAF